ncbi:hypothetical protein [uncultured Hoeflea sp.]|uniref:hypothetical protein n=1 Tax=uncultured Hoeflea sp. TaxID=538666 RepID=UPI0030DD3870
MNHSLSVVSLCLLALASTSAPGRTQDLHDCACSVPVGTKGVVQDVQGKVYLSGPAGMTPALAGTRFDLPANLAVGPKSASTVALAGDCLISIDEDQSLLMKGDSKHWCAVLVSEVAASGAMPDSAIGAASGTLPGAAAGAAFAISVGTVIAIKRSRDRVSR